MHNLIVGASYSGKSNLAKRFAMNAIAAHQNVIVYDPLQSDGWPPSAKKFYTPHGFFDYISTAQSAHVFIDEAKTLWNEDPKKADQIVYQKRHQGLLVYVIGQRAEGMIPPNARNQCSKLFAFKQARKDAETLSLEFSQDQLLELTQLDKGCFFATDSYTIKKCALNYTNGTPPTIEVF